MEMREVSSPGRVTVEGYGPGFFRVGGRIWHEAVLVSERGVAPWGGFEDVAPLVALAGAVDILVIGTGAGMRPLPPGLRAALDEADLAHEPMATGAACRSQVVLMDEGRRTALALLPV